MAYYNDSPLDLHRCRVCRWSIDETTHTECRRHAPIFLKTSTPNDRVFPSVEYNHDWCGDFEMDMVKFFELKERVEK